jgi:hypothetical protein
MATLTGIVAILKDITLMTCAIVGAYVARRGLATWKRQLDGNARYTLAKNLIITLYELRSGVAAVRVPLMEFSPAENENDKKLAEWKGLAEAYQKRWERVTAPQDKLNALFLECAAIHGEDFLGLERKNLQLFLSELYLEIRMHLDRRNPNRQTRTQDNDKVLFGMNDENDEFFCRLAGIIKQFEAKLRPHVQEFHSN